MITRARNDLRNYLVSEENNSTGDDGIEIDENTGINWLMTKLNITNKTKKLSVFINRIG